jgi:hypothetical protein
MSLYDLLHFESVKVEMCVPTAASKRKIAKTATRLRIDLFDRDILA